MMPRILIIEDHRDFRQAVRRFLELNKIGAQMLEASSGEEGVLIARKSKPRVVIMDYYLKGINGIEAARQIKDNDPACNIIMLTMFDPKEVTHVDQSRIIKAYVGKSELYDRLIPTIDKIMHN